MRNTYSTSLLCLSLVLPALGLHAVSVPPPSSAAGVLERTIEREYEAKPLPAEKEFPVLEIEVPQEQFNIPEGTCVLVKELQFTGNTVFSSEKLKEKTGHYLHRNLCMAEIRDLCNEIRALYVRKGYFLARAFPPVQEIKDGLLTIEIVEGRLGAVTIEGNKHYSTHFIRRYFTPLIGKPLNYDEFLKKLMLLNEFEDLAIGAIFEKGKKFGTADLILRVKDARPVHLFVDVNNYGSRQTSLYRAGGRLDYGNFVTQGDTFSIAEVVGIPLKQLNFTDAIYRIPLNASGTTFEASYLYTTSRVNKFTILELRGLSQIGEVKLSQALLRTRRLNTDIFVTFDIKHLKNSARGLHDTVDNLRVLRLGYSLNYFDTNRGNNFADFSIFWGIPRILWGSRAVDPRASRPGSGGRFVYLTANYRRLQLLPYDAFLVFNASGQYSFYKLPLAEQIYIGGIDTVRGYPLACALGDSGYYGNLELRVPPPWRNAHIWKGKRWKEFLQLVGFIDHGGVYLRHGLVEDQRNFLTLTSVGAGLRLYGPARFSANFDMGFPLTEPKKRQSPIYYFKVNWTPF